MKSPIFEAILLLIRSFRDSLTVSSTPASNPPETPPAGSPEPVTPVSPPISSPGPALRIGMQIVQFEAADGDPYRRDENNHIKPYGLPSSDGGAGNGISYEYAGINGKYHPDQVRKLNAMAPKDREAECARYIETYAKQGTGVDEFDVRIGTALFIFDCAFNRGPGGAGVIVQDALVRLGYSMGSMGGSGWGPKTRAALQSADRENPHRIIDALRTAREAYEDDRDRKKGARPDLRPGLLNRWNKCRNIATSWNAHESAAQSPPVVVPPLIAGGRADSNELKEIRLPMEGTDSLNRFYGTANRSGTYLEWFNFPVSNVQLYSRGGTGLSDRDGDGNDEHRCHEKIIDPLEDAFIELLTRLGRQEFERQGWHIYAGCFNYRYKTSGGSLSTHSWGIAIDVNPDQNGWKQYSTSFSDEAFDIMEKYGFLSAYRAWGHDAMHFQRCRFATISKGSYYAKHGLPKHIVPV